MYQEELEADYTAALAATEKSQTNSKTENQELALEMAEGAVHTMGRGVSVRMAREETEPTGVQCIGTKQSLPLAKHTLTKKI